MAGFATTAYNSIFKRTSTFALTILIAGIFFERTFDLAAESIFRSINKGKLFEDIKPKE